MPEENKPPRTSGMLLVSTMNFLKSKKQQPSSQTYFTVQAGMLLSNMNEHPKYCFQNGVRAPSSDNALQNRPPAFVRVCAWEDEQNFSQQWNSS